ncbi:hypothetical protein F5Y18DRAFT_398023 [Xylariaceae sp. FL1019]|nr:hypothetical protein F5Y18DRAFT_398023 [Xylariaceae sp. FL1019]
MSSTSLHMMTKLSPFVYTYEPRETPASSESSAPKLILFAAWMDAQDVHINKYITHYQTIYPSATILLVKFSVKEAVFAPVAVQKVRPALLYLWSVMTAAGGLSAAPERPEILVHVFSNGGCTSMRHIYVGFKKMFGRPFPLHTMIFDSCPGQHKLATSYNALIDGFPKGIFRIITVPFVIFLILALSLWYTSLNCLAGEDFLAKNLRVLNDRKLVDQTNRCYIYGKADIMVDWRHIESHANAAISKGFLVRQERFDESPHVAHMRADRERYWQIVNDTWEKAIVSSS